MIPIYEPKVKHNCDNFNYSEVTCPGCTCVGCFNSHGFYERNRIDYQGNKIIDSKVKIRRLKCKSCGSTHALLDHDIVPYKQYTAPLIYNVFCDRYIDNNTVDEICVKYHISFQLFYTWLKQAELIILFLSIIFSVGSKEISAVLKHIKLLPYINLSKQYYQHHKLFLFQFIPSLL